MPYLVDVASRIKGARNRKQLLQFLSEIIIYHFVIVRNSFMVDGGGGGVKYSCIAYDSD